MIDTFFFLRAEIGNSLLGDIAGLTLRPSWGFCQSFHFSDWSIALRQSAFSNECVFQKLTYYTLHGLVACGVYRSIKHWTVIVHTVIVRSYLLNGSSSCMWSQQTFASARQSGVATNWCRIRRRWPSIAAQGPDHAEYTSANNIWIEIDYKRIPICLLRSHQHKSILAI